VAGLGALPLTYVTAQSFQAKQHVEMLCGSRSVLGLFRLCMLGIAALAWMGNAYPQSIYKWVDSDGVTQYSATPPPASASGTVLRMGPPPPAESASQAKADVERVSEDANRRAAALQREQTQRRAHDEVERNSAATRLQRCASARVQVMTLTRGGPVYRYSDRGERLYLEDSRRDAEIPRLSEEVAMYCSGAANMQSVQDAATRQRTAEATQYWRCNDARDLLRQFEADISKFSSTEIEHARKNVSLFCTDLPKAESTDWFGTVMVGRPR